MLTGERLEDGDVGQQQQAVRGFPAPLLCHSQRAAHLAVKPAPPEAAQADNVEGVSPGLGGVCEHRGSLFI